MNSKVVCLVINSLAGGGAERVFSRLVNLLNIEKNSYKIVVVTLDQEQVQNPINISVEHIQLNCNGSLASSMYQLRKTLNTIQPSLVISFLTRANVAAVFSGIGYSYPVIVSERVNTSSHFGDGLKSRAKKKFTQFFYNKATSIIAVSEGVKKDLVDFFNLNHKKIDVICNSYSYEELIKKSDEFKIEYEDNTFIVCVGRFYKNKNHSLLIKALARSNCSKKLILLGDGPERSNLEMLVRKLDLEKQVIFKGFIKNPYPYIKYSSGLISASLAEGFPNVIAEALVLGKFVVSSDCQSGPAELLDNRVSAGTVHLEYARYGILIPVNDEQLTSKGIELFNDQKTITDYEKKVIPLRYRYSHEMFLNKFKHVIEETLNA